MSPEFFTTQNVGRYESSSSENSLEIRLKDDELNTHRWKENGVNNVIIWCLGVLYLCLIIGARYYGQVRKNACGVQCVYLDVSRFAYKSIRLHRGRFAYTTKSFRLHGLSRFAYIKVVSPTLTSRNVLWRSKKILSTNQNAELTTGIHTLVFLWIFK